MISNTFISGFSLIQGWIHIHCTTNMFKKQINNNNNTHKKKKPTINQNPSQKKTIKMTKFETSNRHKKKKNRPKY